MSKRRNKRKLLEPENQPRPSAAGRRLHAEHLENRILLAGDVVHRVNAGGPALTAATPDWTVEGSFLVTGDNSPGIDAVVSTGSISLPEGTDQATLATLLRTERFDFDEDVTYAFPVTPGEYEVRLYFAETFSGAATVGGRIFDIEIEGVLERDNFDVYVAAGNQQNHGIVETFTVTSDNTLNINLIRGAVQNPAIRGIEIISLDETPNELRADRTSVDFGEVLQNSPINEQVVLTNTGDPGDDDITIDPTVASVNGAEYSFSFSQATTITLTPGQSTTVDVTYTPTNLGVDNAVLSIPHSGTNSPLEINLTGEGVSAVSVGFSSSNLQGASNIGGVTSLQFGPDGKLYVTNRDGDINVLEIERVSQDNYQVIGQETITVIRNIQNHNDQGAVRSGSQRLITGLVVTGTAADPILYVASSDPITSESDQIDTNSGIVSRVTRNAQDQWERLDLVRGIPRSGRDHANSGLQLLDDDTLLHAVGSNTNRGAPGPGFGFTPEYALSAAILSIDLAAIGENTYDLPTLDDPTRPNVQVNGVDVLDQYGTAIDTGEDVFGGNNGLNQARLVPDGPVQIFASGLRNGYDLVVTEGGEVYATDNGPNAGFGNNVEVVNGLPTNGTNGPAGVTRDDQLHFVSEPGRKFFGHTNPTRANPQNTFGGQSPVTGTLNGVPFDLSNPVGAEFPFVEPESVADGALALFPRSTNGIVEYTANNFSGQLRGELLTVSQDGVVTRTAHNPSTGAVTSSQLANVSGGFFALDITSTDSGPLSGIIVVGNLSSQITILEPSDGTGGSPNDLDGDGYTNQDEIDNGTDPNNSASKPSDNDGDFTSDLNDTDDDNDLILDVDDAFAIDAQNGQDTPVGTFYALENFIEPAGGLFNAGFTGAQTNGTLDYLDAVDPTAITSIGAAGVFTFDAALSGTSRGASNDQLQALQFGVNVAQETESFTAVTSLVTPFSDIDPSQTLQAGQESGLYIGTGDQDNYVSLIASGENGGSLQVIREVNGVATVEASLPFALPTSAVNVELLLTVDPIASTVQAAFRTRDAQIINPPPSAVTLVGTPVAIPSSWLTSAALAVGVTSTNVLNVDNTDGGIEDYPVTFGFIGVVRDIDDRSASALVTVDPGGSIQGSSIFGDDSFVIENTSSSGQEITSVTIDLSTAILPDLLFDANGGAGDPVGKDFTPTSGQAATGQISDAFGGARDGGFETLTINFNDFSVGESFGFATDVDPTSIQGDGGSPQNAGEISGWEIAGATISINYNDGTSTVSQLSPIQASQTGSYSDTQAGALAAPGLELLGIGAQPNVVTPDEQTARITAPEGATVVLQHAEAALFTGAGGFDIDPFESNRILSINEQSFVVGAAGFVDVPVTLLRSSAEGGLNYFLATVVDASGRASDVSKVLVEQLSTPTDIPGLVVNVDFNDDNPNNGRNSPTYNGLGAAPDAGSNTFFNSVFNGTGNNLTASDGSTSTTIGVTTTFTDDFVANSATADSELAGAADLFIDYLYTTASSGNVAVQNGTISGLNPLTSYDLYFYGQGDNLDGTGQTNGQNARFTVGGVSKDTGYDGTSGGDGQLAENIEYVLFSDITPDPSGDVDFTWANIQDDANPSISTGFNGLQIVQRTVGGGGTLTGDYNGSGTVEGNDLSVWTGSLGSVTNLAADGDGDDDVDGNDFLIWQRNLGNTQTLAASQSPVVAAATHVELAVLEAPEVLVVSSAPTPAIAAEQAVDQAVTDVILSLDWSSAAVARASEDANEVVDAEPNVAVTASDNSNNQLGLPARDSLLATDAIVDDHESASLQVELSDSAWDGLFDELDS